MAMMPQTRIAVISAITTIVAAVIATFGGLMFDAISDVKDSVAEVHDLANSNLSALREDLARANEQIADLREIIGGMVPAPRPEGEPE